MHTSAHLNGRKHIKYQEVRDLTILYPRFLGIKRRFSYAGTHEYIEVVAYTQVRRKQVAFLVELGFGDEFRVAKACDEYHELIGVLPEIYVGKAEHLNAIVRVVCEAAKKSAEEKKIHMGPWRKRDFMLMKWSASSGRRRYLDYPTSDKLRTNPTVQDSLNVVTSTVGVA
ncbi:hypothetical protein ACS0TY_027914 [Phlomoides rotata]